MADPAEVDYVVHVGIDVGIVAHSAVFPAAAYQNVVEVVVFVAAWEEGEDTTTTGSVVHPAADEEKSAAAAAAACGDVCFVAIVVEEVVVDVPVPEEGFHVWMISHDFLPVHSPNPSSYSRLSQLLLLLLLRMLLRMLLRIATHICIPRR